MYYYHFISRINFLQSYIAEGEATYWTSKQLDNGNHWLNPQITKQTIVCSKVANAIFRKDIA